MHTIRNPNTVNKVCSRSAQDSIKDINQYRTILITMGMFDYLYVDKSIPFPPIDIEVDLYAEVWQTKGLANELSKYFLKNDLLRQKGSLECLESVDYTGKLNFYTYLTDISDHFDYWLEFGAIIINGKLQSSGIELLKCKSISNSSRLKSEEDLRKMLRY